MSLVATEPQPSLAWTFESSNVDYVAGLAPNLSTTGTYAAPTGGTITTAAGQRIHTFTATGTTSITFLVPVTAQVLVVAGGGGGGGSGTSNQTGGGGGAGELYYSASYSIEPGTYTVTVGAGGTRGIGSGTSGGTPTNGGDSIFGTIDCNGGGRGGASGGLDNGGSGGSGGGASRSATGGASDKTAAGFGNVGGNSAGSLAGGTAGGGGGGGAGGAGAAAGPTNDTRAAGGAGRSYSISGASVTYASGGAGGSRNGTTSGASGTANRGNGGGGGDGGAVTNGGNGGSGIVVISYNAALYPAPTYVTGKYGQAINFNNTLSAAGADPNCYATYDVTAFGLSSNSAAMSLWLNSGLTYPISAGPTPFYINLQGGGYNGLYTPSATSSVAFRTGATPAVTVGTVSAQTSVWSHHCAVFSNVGASSSNTITSYYVNGSLTGSANNTIQSFTSLNLGCQTSDSNGALCSLDDVRLFGTALTAAQVQTIYNQQGMPGIFVLSLPSTPSISMTGAPLFNQLSPSAASSAVGAFSLRAVSGVTAKAVQVRNGTTSAIQDFYADERGNLLTAPIVGQTLANWLGGATGYVTTWYDQSGRGNHATQTTAANQPIIQRATKGPGYMVVVNGVNGTTSFGLNFGAYNLLNNTSYSTCGVVRRRASGANNNENYYLSGNGGTLAQDQYFHSGYRTSSALTLAHYGDDMNVTVPSFTAEATEPINYNFMTLGTDKVGRIYSYSGGSLYPSPMTTKTYAGFLNHPVGASLSIGGGFRQFTGEIYELLVFTRSLYDLDGTTSITQIYNNQVGYTGT